jgi:hypothetical protein
VIVVDSLLMGGLSFILRTIAAAVDRELTDDSALREALLSAQMRLEEGEISEEEYVALERDLLQRISEVRARGRAEGEPEEAGGDFTVIGAEAIFTGDEHHR